ncbi:RrF2 family transcriptional regulator [Streptococcus macacae]|uniref:Transcriptional regulator n=1 Tax=Streptococcus macacae NCTC 11558 TaxID=764298 RepID=G5JUP9_9STRE|nr:Rrf2 family transcriptional regulator [Streptococcus macacae]EHJ52415.1 transcriptional regulator [Streptococcus macacae NCTC 11558]SUN78864.1 Rrf2 family transcriptional regulators [Streptococcus macacae NCTC 11558]
MKLNKSFEQATYVITMLALQKGHQPVKSHVLSQILQVSDSYLKKVLMKLSKAGLVSSNASKTGGYQLAKPVEEISLKDIFFALELQADVLDFKHMAYQIYDDGAHVREVEDKVKSTLEKGLGAFYDQLQTLTIADLLQQEAYENGAIDWNERVED